MKQSGLEFLEGLARKPADFNYDGIVVEIFENDVHVRVAGSNVIKKNVLLADHIDKNQLRLGIKVKLDDQRERTGGRQGKPYVVAIYPELDYGDYGGKGSVTPEPPAVSAAADCDTGEWTIAWTKSAGATYYELYWASQSDGSGATQLTETVFRKMNVPFDTDSPPKMYFAVKAISGTNESELSPWVTDLAFINSARMVVFGDDMNHGHVTSSGVRWKVLDGEVLKSTNNGASWIDVTPDGPGNDFTQTPAPEADDISYIQVFGDDDKIFLLGTYDDLSLKGGWIFWSDDEGESWLDKPATGVASPLQIFPVWGAVNDTYVCLVVWIETSGSDEELHYVIYDNDETLTNSEYETMIEDTGYDDLVARSAYAFPVAVSDDDDVFFFGGRIDGFISPGTVENIFYYVVGDDYYSVESGWGDDWCSSLVVGPDDGEDNRAIWYTREALA